VYETVIPNEELFSARPLTKLGTRAAVDCTSCSATNVQLRATGVPPRGKPTAAAYNENELQTTERIRFQLVSGADETLIDSAGNHRCQSAGARWRHGRNDGFLRMPKHSATDEISLRPVDQSNDRMRQ
jgi:hypothetical protein